MNQETNKEQRNGQIKFLNLYGDITLEWNEEDHIKMLEVIKQKLDEGFSFYILKDKFCGIPFTGGKKKLKKISNLSGNKVLIKDETISKYFNHITSASIVKEEEKEYNVTKVSKDPETIARNTSVCVKPAVAG